MNTQEIKGRDLAIVLSAMGAAGFQPVPHLELQVPGAKSVLVRYCGDSDAARHDLEEVFYAMGGEDLAASMVSPAHAEKAVNISWLAEVILASCAMYRSTVEAIAQMMRDLAEGKLTRQDFSCA